MPVGPETDKDMADMTALMFGAMLHDIGKVVYRGMAPGAGTHARLGADFLKGRISILTAT